MNGFEGMAIGDLITRYQEAASRHGEATLDPDASVANRSADTITSLYRELRRRDAQSALLVLLESDDMGVRSWAAAHAMEFAPEEGEPVLEALADSRESGLIGTGAELTLREWRAGRLRFP